MAADAAPPRARVVLLQVQPLGGKHLHLQPRLTLALLRPLNEAEDRKRVRRALSADEAQRLIAAARSRPLALATAERKLSGVSESERVRLACRGLPDPSRVVARSVVSPRLPPLGPSVSVGRRILRHGGVRRGSHDPR